MKNEIEAMITDITATTAEAEDYTGEDGLLYCGKCHTPKEAYFSKETAQWLGHDRHPSECDCQRAAREKREAAESRQKHLETVEDLKRRGFTDPAMRNWTFEHDNGRNPQTETARFYVESWETMQAENIGYLFWGGVGTGKSYLAACIANALMEKEVAVCMTNFATILNDLAASFDGRNEYISRLCSYPLLILDDFGMMIFAPSCSTPVCPNRRSSSSTTQIQRTRKQNFSPRYAADRCVCCWAALQRWEPVQMSRRFLWQCIIWM